MKTLLIISFATLLLTAECQYEPIETTEQIQIDTVWKDSIVLPLK